MRLKPLLQRTVIPFKFPSVLIIKVLRLCLLLLDQVDLFSMRDELLIVWICLCLHLILEDGGQVIAALEGKHAAALLRQDWISVCREGSLLHLLVLVLRNRVYVFTSLSKSPVFD